MSSSESKISSALQPELTNAFEVHKAVRDDNVSLVRGLVSAKPEIVVLKDDDGRTPLHWACLRNSTELVEYLLKAAGADAKDLVNAGDASGWTPVHIAAAVGGRKTLERLAAFGGDLNAKTNIGATPLQLAIGKNQDSTARELVERYGSNCRTKDSRGRTALHRAASGGRSGTVAWLVAAGAAINATDVDGWTALHHALAEGHASCAADLIALGADATASTKDGQSPLDVCSTVDVKRDFEEALRSRSNSN